MTERSAHIIKIIISALENTVNLSPGERIFVCNAVIKLASAETDAIAKELLIQAEEAIHDASFNK